jgi:hypothetical protein
VIAVSLTAAACGYMPGIGPGQTHMDGTEQQPGPGSVVVEGDPPRATEPLVIQFVGPEGNVFEQRTARIPSGGVIRASTFSLPGLLRLLVNGTMCEGDFAIESERRTGVVLRVSDTGCSVRSESTEPT